MSYRSERLVVALLVLSLAGLSEAQAPPVPPEEEPAGSEVLTRGPVNEAYAEPVALQGQEGLVAPKQPPPNIDEVPPDERPEGQRYVWVPGYWGWDSDRNDFIWVSACWRVAPPNMRWVPGYWTAVSAGWEWVPGFWTPAGSREIEYLPPPPAAVDVEPLGSPPGPASVWVPGCWYWTQGRYVERRGYWLQEQPGWVWVPSHYRFSPRGYVFISGHWDYALDQRGVLFAPVYFPPAVYARVGFSFSPGIVIDIGLLIGNLFVYPHYSHYYFGDDYDDHYSRAGIYPQFESERVRTWYDPVYQYERWNHRKDDPRWDEHRREDYDRRRADKDLRPPRTYREMETRVARLPEPQRRGVELAGPLRTVVARESNPLKLERITNVTREKIAVKGADVRKYRDERVKWETPAAARPASPPAAERSARAVAPGGPKGPPEPSREARASTGSPEHAPPAAAPRQAAPTRPERVKIPTSPVADKPVSQWGKSRKAPPPTPSGERKSQGKAPTKERQDEKGGKKETQGR